MNPSPRRFSQPDLIRQSLKKALFLKTASLFAAAALVFWLVVFEWKVKDAFLRLGFYAVSVILIFLFSNWLDTLFDVKRLSEKVARLDAEELDRKKRETEKAKEDETRVP